MATVYRARQHTFDRNVALKVLKPNLSEEESFGIRFINESLIVAKLHHSNIVQVYDVGEVQNRYYISMEYLSGGDLTSRLKKGLPEHEAVKIIKQMASALDFAHKRDIVHRDMKPENVMFREDGAAVLTDFGIAKETDHDLNLTETGMIVGTPKFMAPEQIRGEKAHPSGDIYSLGVMFYQLLVGDVPFHGPDFMSTAYMHFNDPVPPLPLAYKKYQLLIEDMMAKEVSDRMASGAEVVERLEEMERHHFQDHEEAPALEDQDGTLIVDSKIITEVNPESPKVSKATEKKAKRYNAETEVATRVELKRKKVKSKRNAFIIAAVLSIAVIGGGVVVTTQQRQMQDTETTQVQTPQDQKIQALLEQAKQDIKQLRLRKGDSNAYDKYLAVLKLDPGNADAQLGIQFVAKKYLELATKALEKEDIEGAENYLNNAKEIAPDVSTKDVVFRLNALKEEKRKTSKSYILSVKQTMQVSGLLQAAKLDEKEGRVTTPKGENAYEKYLKILEIDPQNKIALERIEALKN